MLERKKRKPLLKTRPKEKDNRHPTDPAEKNHILVLSAPAGRRTKKTANPEGRRNRLVSRKKGGGGKRVNLIFHPTEGERGPKKEKRGGGGA